MNAFNILGAKLPKRHEITQNFDANLPKKYENIDTVDQPWGGGSDPRPPTSFVYNDVQYSLMVNGIGGQVNAKR